MSSSHKIRSTDGKGIAALLRRIKNPGTVNVGIIDAGIHGEGPYTTAQIGFVHEFGAGNIPERSFIRSTLHTDRKEFLALSKKLLKEVASGNMTMDQALGLLGELGRDKISQKIVKISSPPNSPATITAKGSSNPLVDTGQLKNSITWEINR